MNANGAGWKEVKLGSILRYLDERLTMDDEKEYLTITVKRRHGGLEIREKLFGHQIATKKQFRLVPGAFIISRVQCWHQAYAIVGDVPANTIASTNYDQFAISPEVDPRFFWWLSYSPAFTDTVRSSAVGVVIEKMVFNRERWLTKSVRLPPLAEQRRVVARIEELAVQINEARTLRHQATEEAEVILRARLNEFVEMAAATNMPTRTVGDFTRFDRYGPRFYDQGYSEIGTPIVRATDIDDRGHIDFSTMPKLEVSPEDVKKLKIEVGDLLVVRSGSIGLSAVFNRPDVSCIPAAYLIQFRFDQSADPYFVRYCFQATPIQSELVGRGTTVQNLNAKKIKSTRIPFPPLPEQSRIVAELDALQAEVDALKRLQAETAAELDALLPSILDKAFKGEL